MSRNCELYQELSLPEKWELIGKIVHLLQNDEATFKEVKWIISSAEQTGKLDNVQINPIKPNL